MSRYVRRRLSMQRLEDRTVPNTYTVTSAGDSLIDMNDFRSAIENANKNVGADTIVFDSSFNNPPLTITLTSGELAISGSLTVVGPPSGVTIDGNNNGRVFNISGTGTVVVSMSDLTITGGKATGMEQGGGILNTGKDLTLTRCTISNNTTSSAGGGIAVAGGSLTLLDSTVSGNKGAGGGGIRFNGPPSAAGFTVRNSTISGNSTDVGGGGISLGLGFNGTCKVQNSTIAANASDATGGGIFRDQFSTSTIHLESTIVSGNTGKTGNNDISNGGTVTTNFCAIGDGTGFSLSGNNNLAFGLNLLLGPLTGNGGRTFTHKPAANSPVVDKGTNSALELTDQRGTGYGRTRGVATDIGAIELRQDIIVYNTDDSSAGSLRRAISDSNTWIGSDTIVFDPAMFATPRTITLFSGDMTINDFLTIQGPGSQLLTIQGNGNDRHLTIVANDINVMVNITGMKFNGGVQTGTLFFTDQGGSIYVEDVLLFLTDVTVTNNSAKVNGGALAARGTSKVSAKNCLFDGNFIDGAHNYFGGAIFMEDFAYVTLEDSTFTNNKAFSSQGKICSGGVLGSASSGSVTIRRCTFTGNFAGNSLTDPTSGNNGGVLSNFTQDGDSPFWLVENSTFIGNAAGPSGGVFVGHQVAGAGSGTFTFRNTTMSGNVANVNGGAIRLRDTFTGTLNIQNCTIVNNVAKTGHGGAISNGGAAGTLVKIDGSIMGNNTAATSGDLAGAVTVNYSLISAIDGALVSGGNNQSGTLAVPLDPQIGPLADHGGPTLTHALLPGSPCLDAGSNIASLQYDQRGNPFVRAFSTGKPDIGAYEFQPGAKVLSVQVNDGSPQRSRVTSLTVTFDSAVTLPANKADAFQLKRQSDNASVALSASMTGNVVTLIFTGGPLELSSLADGRYTLTVLASKVNAGLLDGNSDGGAGDGYVLIGTPANGLFRFFGDADGDGAVAANDFIQFRLALGGNNPIFDFDNDGAVAASDFIQFRLRFGGGI